MKLADTRIGANGPEARDFGILVSDLRGFTPMLESHPPFAVVELLNHYYREMAAIIDGNRGRVDKFMGDSVMALFDGTSDPQAPHNLLNCVIEMQLAMDGVNAHARRLGLPGIYMGIGINYGSMIACELGSDIYREFTVVGDQVNLTSRLATHCLRGQVLMTADLHHLLRDSVEVGRVNELHFKGSSRALTVYEVLGQKSPKKRLLPVRDSRKSCRIDTILPLNYFVIENKVLAPQALSAQVLDLSQEGLRFVASRRHDCLEEMKLCLPFLSASEREVYAKVLMCREEEAGHFSTSVEFTWLDETTSIALARFVNRV